MTAAVRSIALDTRGSRRTLREIWQAALAIIAATTASGVCAAVLVEAHRGNSSVAPENTLAAISAAAGVADLTEWDVQMTADGQFVLMHDATVDRTTDGVGQVANLTLSQIAALDAGSWFSSAFVGERVPTFAAAVDAARAAGLTPLIERKAGGTPLDYHLAFAAMNLQPAEFRLISFDWAFLDQLDALDSTYNLGALGSGAVTQAKIDSAKAAGADFLDWEHSSLTPTVVDLVHANGLELHAWTVDSSTRMQQLIDMNVDGITTNVPATLSALVLQASRTADVNGDLVVDAADWRQYHAGRGVDLSGLSLAEAYRRGDMDGDLDNDVADFVRFRSLYEAAIGGGSFRMVAEPTAATLVAPALASLAVGARRRRRHAPRTAAHQDLISPDA